MSSKDTASVDVVPTSSTGTFVVSATGDEAEFTVTTDNLTGYSLNILGTDTSGQLVNTSTGDILDTISSDTTENDFRTGAASTYNNKWGYRLNVNSTTTTDFMAAPTSSTAKTIYTTTSPNAVGTPDNYTLSLGARVDYTKPSGTYTNTFVLTAVGNPITYQINYLDNTGSGGTTGTDVSGLPAAEGQSNITASAFTLATTTPTRTGYDFIGWCDGDVTHDATGTDTCATGSATPGTVYQAGDAYTFTNISSAGTNTANLYAMWEFKPPLLYDVIAEMSKGTQTAAQLQATITVPTSADRTQDTSNSGVYEYNTSVFGTATDASNDYKIYYYRGVLENSVGSYGSDGSAVTYPNYVKLGNTCWRILRTTGSGGVKMIYNGLYGATTAGSCANAATKAQFSSTSAFDTTADSSGKSIVGVGYTYNASYKSTTASTQAGTLFGTNSSDSNTTNSTIKTNIDSWYTSNLNTYTSHLEPSAGYCNDRRLATSSSATSWSDTTSITTPYSTATSGNTTYYFASYVRNVTTALNPTLNCGRSTVDLYTTSSASNGNKRLTNPIALITADEASFAGSGYGGSGYPQYNSNSFLRSGSVFWLLSPYRRNSDGNARVFFLNLSGFLSSSSVNYPYGVRPAISLSQGATISSGTGVATDPWEVSW